MAEDRSNQSLQLYVNEDDGPVYSNSGEHGAKEIEIDDVEPGTKVEKGSYLLSWIDDDTFVESELVDVPGFEVPTTTTTTTKAPTTTSTTSTTTKKPTTTSTTSTTTKAPTTTSTTSTTTKKPTTTSTTSTTTKKPTTTTTTTTTEKGSDTPLVPSDAPADITSSSFYKQGLADAVSDEITNTKDHSNAWSNSYAEYYLGNPNMPNIYPPDAWTEDLQRLYDIPATVDDDRSPLYMYATGYSDKVKALYAELKGSYKGEFWPSQDAMSGDTAQDNFKKVAAAFVAANPDATKQIK